MTTAESYQQSLMTHMAGMLAIPYEQLAETFVLSSSAQEVSLRLQANTQQMQRRLARVRRALKPWSHDLTIQTMAESLGWSTSKCRRRLRQAKTRKYGGLIHP